MKNPVEISTDTKLVAPVVDMTHYFRTQAYIMLDYLERLSDKYMPEDDIKWLKQLNETFENIKNTPDVQVTLKDVEVEVVVDIDPEYEDATCEYHIEDDDIKCAETSNLYHNFFGQLVGLYRRYCSEEMHIPQMSA